MKKNKGFTLIELLVVVAIIGILASIILSSTTKSRLRGNDAAIKSNLSTMRSQSEIFYLNNGNSYLPAGGATFALGTCPTYNVSGTDMLSQTKIIADSIATAVSVGSGSSCYNSADAWAVAVGMRENANTSWCVDNTGTAKQVLSGPALAINPGTFTCN